MHSLYKIDKKSVTKRKSFIVKLETACFCNLATIRTVPAEKSCKYIVSL